MDKLQRIKKNIQGWLPEPKLPQLNGKILAETETKVQHSGGYSIDKEVIPAYLIFAAIGIVSVSLNHNLLLPMQIVWVILGLSIGLSIGTIMTLKQLEFLAEQGEKRIIGQTVLLIGLLLFFFILVLIPDRILPTNIRIGEYFLIYSTITALVISKSVLLYFWERKNRVRIYQNMWSTYFYLTSESHKKK
jgi:hypothetical protein